MEKAKSIIEHEAFCLNEEASAGVLDDDLAEPGDSSGGATTKHARHRSGCICIVCIKPPSGKGRHRATCTCPACITVKRRLDTLMTRKQQWQSEGEADGSQNDDIYEEGELSAGQIDLNCRPNHDEDMQVDI